MSQWTHVTGIIRLDSMGAIVTGPAPTKNLKIREAAVRALGKTSDYHLEPGAWDECTVPCGSEGSLQYNVYPNSDSDDHALTWGYASIWGDLRDFGIENLQEVYDWFKGSLERLQKPKGFSSPENMVMPEKVEYVLSTFVIRQAVLSIDVEFGPRVVLLWDDDKHAVVKLLSVNEELGWGVDRGAQ